jgi:hypothetical protein
LVVSILIRSAANDAARSAVVGVTSRSSGTIQAMTWAAGEIGVVSRLT